jgi:carboxylate-amine ligase
MIEQNRWSACRDGVEGSMVELETGERRPTRALLEALLGSLGEVSRGLRADGELTAAADMVEANGAIRQRAAARDGGPRGVARWLARRFLDPTDG